MRTAIVVGTRPEIIKMAPICQTMEARGMDYFVLHTGQHYDFNMDEVFFKELNIKQPLVNLNVGSGTHGETTGKMLIGIEKALVQHRPDWILVNGDTNTTMAGALAAAKLHILVGHVEAGLRNYDRRMPEEYNRIVADHVSDYLFATSTLTEKNLIDEGIGKKADYLYFGGFPGPKIFLTGNTIVDVIHDIIGKIDAGAAISELGLEGRNFFYVTVHREENVDHAERLRSILIGLGKVAKKFRVPMVFPIHPRTRKRVEQFGLMKELNQIEGLKLIEPAGFMRHLALVSKAKLVLTDSGGIQEETCTLKVPGVVLREVTDRPEGLKVGATMLTSLDPDRILQVSSEMVGKQGNWENPYGDGQAGARIVDLVSGYKRD